MGEARQGSITLGQLLKSEGRTQVWLRSELSKIGISRTTVQINHWCTGKFKPNDHKIIDSISQILNVSKEVINNCLNK